MDSTTAHGNPMTATRLQTAATIVAATFLLVGVLGSGIGCVLGLLLGGGIARSLVWLGSAPNGFTLQLSGPTMYVALPVSFATGLIVTWFGARSAAPDNSFLAKSTRRSSPRSRITTFSGSA